MRVRGRAGTLLILLLAAPFAGCLAEESPAGEVREAGAASGTRPVVVALIDTGINPYHQAFGADPGQGAESVAELLGAQIVNITQEGAWQGQVDADEAAWNDLASNRLYAFAGTRVLGISLSQSREGRVLFDFVGHGTGTASVVAREAPGSWIVMVQVDTSACVPTEGCLPVAAAMAWAAEQPWIDVISVSVGYPGNVPFTGATNGDVEPYLAASRKAHDAGKILISAAGNTVVPPVASYLAGPPWVIAVGGSQGTSRGEATFASKTTDVVANYTQSVASHDSVDGMRWESGTSYAAPLVAGTLAEALRLVREARPEEAPPRGSSLRQAMNATAVQFRPTDWDPTRMPAESWRDNLPATSVPIVAAPLQMGWGYVHGGMAPEIARRVLEDDLAVPPEKAQTAAYMAQWQGLREAYWERMS